MIAAAKQKFSIILPVRNGGSYVKTCIESILSQTVNNFNLIILDNCSTDGTLEYVQSLPDEKIVLYPSDKPLTIEENWGRILTINKNELITLIGHDDVLRSFYLAEMQQLIATYPEASLYQTHFTYIDSEGITIRKCKPITEVEDGPSFLKMILQNKADLMGTGFMMRSADFDTIGGMPVYPNLLFADLELWLNLSDISFKATSQKECFSFRLHQSTTSLTPDLKFQLAFDKFIHFLASIKERNHKYRDIVRRYGNEFLLFYCRGLAHRLLRTPKKKREGVSVKSFLEKCMHYANLLETYDFRPASVPGIFIAKMLDSNAAGRYLFLLFKKVFKKPLLK